MWWSSVPIVTLLLFTIHISRGDQEQIFTYDYEDSTNSTPVVDKDEQYQVNISQKQNLSQKKLETVTKTIIDNLIQERENMQIKLSELNKNYCDLRTHLAKLTSNALEDTEQLLEIEAVDIDIKYRDCSKFTHIIKLLRTEAILESQSHKRSIESMRMDHMQSMYRTRAENLQINDRLKTECMQSKTEMLREMDRIKIEKQKLDEDISRLRKLRRENTDLEITKLKQEKNMIQTNIELVKENHELKLLIHSLNLTNINNNIILNTELKESIDKLTLVDRKNLECQNNINNLTFQLQSNKENLTKLEFEIENLKMENFKLNNETTFLKEVKINLEAELKIANLSLQKYKRDEPQYFIDLNIEKNWSEAKSHCEELNMELAKIETTTEKEKLYNYLTAQGSWDHIWLGSTDADKEEIWNWGDTNIPVDTSNMCVDHSKSRNANCLTSCKHGPKLNWHSLDCNTIQPFLCENKHYSM